MTVVLIAVNVVVYLLSLRYDALLLVLLDILFLVLFGPSVEGSLGRVRFCAFCLLGGVFAMAASTLLSISSPSPLLFGVSGVIPAVLGGYLRLHPHGRVLSLIVVPFLVTIVEVPAVFLLGFWFIVQLYFGAAGLGSPLGASDDVGYFTHVGDFMLGLALIGLFTKHHRRTPPPHPMY